MGPAPNADKGMPNNNATTGPITGINANIVFHLLLKLICERLWSCSRRYNYSLTVHVYKNFVIKPRNRKMASFGARVSYNVSEWSFSTLVKASRRWEKRDRFSPSALSAHKVVYCLCITVILTTISPCFLPLLCCRRCCFTDIRVFVYSCELYKHNQEPNIPNRLKLTSKKRDEIENKAAATQIKRRMTLTGLLFSRSSMEHWPEEIDQN